MTAPKITRRTLDDGTEILETSDRLTAQQVADLYDVTPCLVPPYRGACPPGVECELCDPPDHDPSYRPALGTLIATSLVGWVAIGVLVAVGYILWTLGVAVAGWISA